MSESVSVARLIDPYCPNCGNADYLFYGSSWCASCGWHVPGTTTQHADFAPDPECQWCSPEPVVSGPSGP